MRAEGRTAQAIATTGRCPAHRVPLGQSAPGRGDPALAVNGRGRRKGSRGTGALGRTSPSGRRCAAQGSGDGGFAGCPVDPASGPGVDRERDNGVAADPVGGA